VEGGNTAFLYPAEISPKDFFQQFIDVFERKGWLNVNLRIRHKGRRYRVLCSAKEFLAYRINENCGITPGIPGWPVCMINHERIIEDAHMSAFVSDEPCAYEWLVHLADSKVEII
jgi:hypothetical protein